MDPMTIVEVERGVHEVPFETALFGMGCFWGPESRFGGISAVLRTRVGYAGGTSENPTYRKLDDHTETVEVDFDPRLVSYEELLKVFWNNHYPNRDAYKGRQYLSILRYRNEKQLHDITRIKKEMEASIGEGIETEIAPFESFTLAEPRHQKYYLKRYPKALEQIEVLYPDLGMLVDSTFAARLNGFVKGFGTRQDLLTEVKKWPITSDAQQLLIDRLQNMKC
ncbi:peptide-methionine (S)-S-oxide reductase [Sporosarcina sp. BI001-red]|uniref:peptide-methionine (S)-S-oxide reductase MsrA n=1 Tax=Sporosarcina sp. BI001-red TaxID=2282866 RepID=UPI000E279065|nr:peptide-methionine (S)-S-oxide reductase MsrA [Sporosarcina sp. BI001-red]REB05273.1 peptide-methionine (S)-S-oxide reductase [Sporosarcina sp. BI001-red]